MCSWLLLDWLDSSWEATVYIGIVVSITTLVFIVLVANLLVGAIGIGGVDDVIGILFC